MPHLQTQGTGTSSTWCSEGWGRCKDRREVGDPARDLSLPPEPQSPREVSELGWEGVAGVG